jgi:hypothetical protein
LELTPVAAIIKSNNIKLMHSRMATSNVLDDSIKSICVYCGSQPGNDPAYARAARDLGTSMAQGNLALIYGGARVGLMGILADAVLEQGGRVVGVMPQQLVDREIAHVALSELHIVQTMHERKQMMADLADAFVLMPGGFGSWEEFCEAITWSNLGLHRKACGILNVNDYYAPFIAMISRSVGEGFSRASQCDPIVVESIAEQLLDRLLRSQANPRQTTTAARG